MLYEADAEHEDARSPSATSHSLCGLGASATHATSRVTVAERLAGLARLVRRSCCVRVAHFAPLIVGCRGSGMLGLGLRTRAR